MTNDFDWVQVPTYEITRTLPGEPGTLVIERVDAMTVAHNDGHIEAPTGWSGCSPSVSRSVPLRPQRHVSREAPRTDLLPEAAGLVTWSIKEVQTTDHQLRRDREGQETLQDALRHGWEPYAHPHHSWTMTQPPQEE